MNKASVLLEILNCIKDFPEKDKKDVEEFIEHYELGIALETICSVVLEDKIAVDNQTYERIVLVGNEMKLDSGLWNDIKGMVQ